MVDDNRISTGPILEPPRRQSLPSSFQQLRVHTDWRTSWTHIVAGKFSDAHDDGVLFYEGSTGFAEIYDTDGHGNLSLLRQHQDLGRIGSRSHRWTQIIAGRFSSSQNSSLLLVDAHSRFAAIFNVDATGNLIKLREFPNWGTWTHVTIVRVPGSDFSAVLRYNQATGRGEILECDGTAGLHLRQASDGWRRSWSHVVGGFACGTSVLFYEQSTGHCEIYQLTYNPEDATTDVNNLRRADGGWRTSWDLITVGPFIGNGRAQVLLYDRAGGTADIVGFDSAGNVNLDTSNTGWRPSWDWMVSGQFLQSGKSEVWLCDRAGNFAEIVAFDAAGNFRSLHTIDGFGSNLAAAVVGDFMDLGPGKQQILRYANQLGSDADIVSPLDAGHDIVAGDWMGRAWDLLVAGRFTGASRTEYLRYIAADGFAEMYGIQGTMTRLQEYSGWRSSWVLAATGRFLGNGRDQLALYDRGRF